MASNIQNTAEVVLLIYVDLVTDCRAKIGERVAVDRYLRAVRAETCVRVLELEKEHLRDRILCLDKASEHGHKNVTPFLSVNKTDLKTRKRRF